MCSKKQSVWIKLGSGGFRDSAALLTRVMRFLGLAQDFHEPANCNVDMRADVRGCVALIEELKRQCEEVHRLHSWIVRSFHFLPRPLAPRRRFYSLRGKAQVNPLMEHNSLMGFAPNRMDSKPGVRGARPNGPLWIW